MAYSVKKSIEKGSSGAIDGVIAGVITALIIGVIKANIQGLDQNTENAIAAGVGTIVASVVIAAKKFIENWMKHKDLGSDPAPTPPTTPKA